MEKYQQHTEFLVKTGTDSTLILINEIKCSYMFRKKNSIQFFKPAIDNMIEQNKVETFVMIEKVNMRRD